MRESLTSIEGGRRGGVARYGVSPLVIASVISTAIIFICATYLVAKMQSAELIAAERHQRVLQQLVNSEHQIAISLDRIERDLKLSQLKYEEDIRTNSRACVDRRR